MSFGNVTELIEIFLQEFHEIDENAYVISCDYEILRRWYNENSELIQTYNNYPIYTDDADGSSSGHGQNALDEGMQRFMNTMQNYVTQRRALYNHTCKFATASFADQYHAFHTLQASFKSLDRLRMGTLSHANQILIGLEKFKDIVQSTTPHMAQYRSDRMRSMLYRSHT